MIWLYRVLFLPLIFCALPYYLFRMWKRGGYRRDFTHRFGSIHSIPIKKDGIRRIWIQAVSVGELLALGPLLKELASNPNCEVFLTTTTSTGRSLAEKNYATLTAWRGIFPLDFVCFSKRAWNKINPDLVILMESELWPEHLHQASVRKVPALLLNARMSDKSLKRYLHLSVLAKPILRPISEVLASTQQDMDRCRHLFPATTPVKLAGNLKFDLDLKPHLDESARSQLRMELGFATTDLILLGSSTWPGEERLIAQFIESARSEGIPICGLIVPRHAERKNEIARDLSTISLRTHFRSDQHQAPEHTELYIADTTGELRMFTQIADLALIGKSIPPHSQGQTPIEAAGYGIPLVFGPEMSNFREIARSLLNANAAIQVKDAHDAAQALKLLAMDPTLRREKSRAAQQWMHAHRGATEIALKTISEYIHRT